MTPTQKQNQKNLPFSQQNLTIQHYPKCLIALCVPQKFLLKLKILMVVNTCKYFHEKIFSASLPNNNTTLFMNHTISEV